MRSVDAVLTAGRTRTALAEARRRAARDDAGFTLVELVISVAILGFLMAAITATLLFVISTTGETTERLDVNGDLQIAGAYLANDVQSSCAVSGNAAGDPCTGVTAVATGVAMGCGQSGTAALRLSGVAFAAPDTPAPVPAPTTAPTSELTATYYVVRVDGSENQLHRVTCGTSTPTTDTVVMRTLSSTPPAVVGGCTPGAPLASPFAVVGLQLSTVDGGSHVLCGTRRTS